MQSGFTIFALQHCCGVNDSPVNCYIDGRGNWECPNCLTTYGAATPIDPTARMSVATVHSEEEDE